MMNSTLKTNLNYKKHIIKSLMNLFSMELKQYMSWKGMVITTKKKNWGKLTLLHLIRKI